jgi:hypothetical protein
MTAVNNKRCPCVCLPVCLSVTGTTHQKTRTNVSNIGSRFRRIIGCAVLNTLRLQMVYSLAKYTCLTDTLFISKIPYDFVVHA